MHSELSSAQERLKDLSESERVLRHEVEQLRVSLQDRSWKLNRMESLASELSSINSSLSFKLIRSYWSVRERVLPPDTGRGRWYERNKHRIKRLTENHQSWMGLLQRKILPGSRKSTKASLRVALEQPWTVPLSVLSSPSLGRRILIIAELSLPQCKRYRVDQKVEMLRLLGYDVTVLRWNDDAACRSALALHGLVIFYRVPAFPGVMSLIEEAKRLTLPHFFDVDDLIFDVEEYSRNSNTLSLPEDERKLLLNGAALYQTALKQCDHAIASTQVIAERMKHWNRGSIYVVENCLDKGVLALAEEMRQRPMPVDPSTLTIGYGSGTRTHDADFECASKALLVVLERYPQVRLAIHGYLKLPQAFERYSDRVYRIPFLAADDYLRAVSSWQISLAPLESTVFNDAKSNIKFIEASLFGVPTVCSPADAFRGVVEHGVNGLMAATSDEWVAALTALIESPELRQKIGTDARRFVMERYHPEQVALNQLAPVMQHLPVQSSAALRVLEVNLLFSPQSYGGATIVTEQLAQRLNRQGCDVTVFTGLFHSPFPDYGVVRYEAEGLPVIAVQLPRDMDRELEYVNPTMRDLFVQVLRTTRPEVVHFHSIQQLSASLAEACLAEGIPYVITLHDAWWLCERQFMVKANGQDCRQTNVDLRVCSKCVPDSAFTFRRSLALRRVLDGAALLLTPSEYQRSLYLANGVAPEKIVVNKNGVHAPQKQRVLKPAIQRPLRLAYLGGRAAHKGYFWLKQILESVPESNYTLLLTDIQLKLGASSIDVEDWQVRGKVEVVAPYAQNDLDAFFEDIDVLLLPSLCRESFGLAAREALLRDVWVISTDAGGMGEDILEGINGNVIPMRDTGAFTHALRQLLQHPERLALYRNPASGHIRELDTQALELKALVSGVVRQN